MLSWAFGPVSWAHPSWGIVATGQGDVYFVDILHNGGGTLWKYSAKGDLSKVHSDFHAHNLELDAEGDLWLAEMVWKEGEIEGEGHHRLLRITLGGRKDTLLFSEDPSSFSGVNFGVDATQNIFFVEENTVFRRSLDGPVEEIPSPRFERINCLEVDDRGKVWVLDNYKQGGSLWYWTPAEGWKLYAANLYDQRTDQALFEEKHLHIFYAIYIDGAGVPYICDNFSRSVRKLSHDSAPETLFQSDKHWNPLGIAFRGKEMLVLEAGYHKRNIGPRLVSVNPQKGTRVLVDVEQGPQTESLLKQEPEEEKDSSLVFVFFIFIPLAVGIIITLIFFRRKQQSTGDI